MKNINDRQVRHESLIDFLSQFPQYQNEGKPSLPKVKKERHSGEVQDIDANSITNAVIVFIDTLNIGGGSIGDIDLYRLLQAYLAMPECRKDINNLVNEAHRRNYQNKQ